MAMFSPSMTSEELCEWLQNHEEVELDDEDSALLKGKVDGHTFLNLKREDLKGYGITATAILDSIVDIIKELQKNYQKIEFSEDLSKDKLYQWLIQEGIDRHDCEKLRGQKYKGKSFLKLNRERIENLQLGAKSVEKIEALLARIKKGDSAPTLETPGAVQLAAEARKDGDLIAYFLTQKDETDHSDSLDEAKIKPVKPGRALEAWSPQDHVWKDKEKLRVYFYKPAPEGGLTYRNIPINANTIVDWAREWNRLPKADQEQAKFVPQFEFSDDKQYAEIRVMFSSEGTSWSVLGTDAETVTDKDEPTMVLNLNCSDHNKKARVVHEFGHVLGLGHEHQHPDFWKHIEECLDLKKMRASLKLDVSGFDKQWRGKADSSSPRTEYDVESVMHYWFKVAWLKPQYQNIDIVRRIDDKDPKKKPLLGVHERINNVQDKLSESDQKFIAKLYYEKNKNLNGAQETAVIVTPLYGQLRPSANLRPTPTPTELPKDTQDGPFKVTYADGNAYWKVHLDRGGKYSLIGTNNIDDASLFYMPQAHLPQKPNEYFIMWKKDDHSSQRYLSTSINKITGKQEGPIRMKVSKPTHFTLRKPPLAKEDLSLAIMEREALFFKLASRKGARKSYLAMTHGTAKDSCCVHSIDEHDNGKYMTFKLVPFMAHM